MLQRTFTMNCEIIVNFRVIIINVLCNIKLLNMANVVQIGYINTGHWLSVRVSVSHTFRPNFWVYIFFELCIPILTRVTVMSRWDIVKVSTFCIATVFYSNISFWNFENSNKWIGSNEWTANNKVTHTGLVMFFVTSQFPVPFTVLTMNFLKL